MVADRRVGRRQVVSDLKRGWILDAARKVFETEGLEGASLRAIAAEAGYTPAALYFHFDSKESIYHELLQASLQKLREAVVTAVAIAPGPAERFRSAAMGFFNFYAENPRDLDLGFYLFRGGMRPKGLGRARDTELNTGLAAALQPIADAASELGATATESNLLMVDVFAHAAGLLLLAHTGRIRMFEASAPDLMLGYVEERIGQLQTGLRITSRAGGTRR